MTARERADTSTRQSDLFAELLAEVVIHDGPERLVVCKLEREGGCLWVTRLLGRRVPVHSLAIASHDLDRVALAYAGEVIWRLGGHSGLNLS